MQIKMVRMYKVLKSAGINFKAARIGFKTVKLEVFVVAGVAGCINDDDDGDDDDDCTIEHRCEYLHWSNTRSKTGEGLSGGKLTKSGEGDGKKEIKTSFVHR